MTQPTASDVRLVDPVQSNVLVSYMQKQDRFVADRAFPGVQVPNDKGTYAIYSKGYWLSDEAERRAYGADYPTSGFAVTSSTFTTEQYALSKMIADEDVANNLTPMGLRTAATRWLGLKFLIRKERLFAAAAMASSVWATDTSVSNKWNDGVAGDPVGDVRTGKRTISQSTGFKPNVMIMGEIVEDRLILHPDIIDRLKYVQAATAETIRGALAAIFGIDMILVGEAIYNTAAEGQTASISPIIDDDALLLYAQPSPSLEEPSGGYNFYWNPGGGQGAILRTVRDDKKDADMAKGKFQLVYKVVATDLGYFMPDCVD